VDRRTPRWTVQQLSAFTPYGRTMVMLLAVLAVLLPLAGTAEEFSQPAPDVWLGGPPDADDLARLSAEGVTWVIDLRTPEEDIEVTATAAAAEGLKYVNFPLGQEFADDELVANVGRALEEARGSGDSVLLHCASGNRAGEVWALHRVAQGADPDEALAEAEAAGTRDERLERLKQALDRD